MRLEAITPVILTFNEEPNIGRTLEKLRWADDIVVVDSGSTDRTLEIIRGFDNVRIESRPFDTHAAQWNFAIDRANTDWVLSLDADYQVDAGFVSEIRALDAGDVVAWYAGFRYLVFAKPLRRTILPPRAVLFQSSCCRYVDDGHTQRLQITGASGHLQAKIDHDDRKPLSRWLAAQDRYAKLEAAKLSETSTRELGLADRIRKLKWVAPWMVPLICLFGSGIFLDGWRGVFYSLQRGVAEAILALRLIQRSLTAEKK